MKHRSLFNRFLITLGLGFILSTSLYSEPPNLAVVRHEVIQYHDSGLYQKDLARVSQDAQQYIIHAAIENQHRKHPKKLALVLDIDETSLSNYDKMVKHHFIGTRELIHKEILAGNSPAIKPVLKLYQSAIRHGIKVFFVTGRRESERVATEANLKQAGYTEWSGLYMKPDNYSAPSIIPFKSSTRALITKKGYLIIATIGDQYSDIRGGFALRGFKLPNPYYYLP